jgi:hypothetical protein
VKAAVNVLTLWMRQPDQHRADAYGGFCEDSVIVSVRTVRSSAHSLNTPYGGFCAETAMRLSLKLIRTTLSERGSPINIEQTPKFDFENLMAIPDHTTGLNSGTSCFDPGKNCLTPGKFNLMAIPDHTIGLLPTREFLLPFFFITLKPRVE